MRFLKQARKRKKITQIKMAELLGVHLMTYWGMENGKQTILYKYVEKINEILGIDLIEKMKKELTKK